MAPIQVYAVAGLAACLLVLVIASILEWREKRRYRKEKQRECDDLKSWREKPNVKKSR